MVGFDGLPSAPPPDAFALRKAPTLPPRALPTRPPPARRAFEPVAPSRPPAAASAATRVRPARPMAAAVPATPPPASVLAQASDLADAGDLDGARALLSDLVAGGAATADHYHLLAVIEGARGRDAATGDALRRALYLEPDHYPSLVQQALLAEARGDQEAARRARAKAERVRAAWDAARGAGEKGGGA